jgi:hypothetical protein
MTDISRVVSYIVKKVSNVLPLTWAVPGGTMMVWWQRMPALRGGAKRPIART